MHRIVAKHFVANPEHKPYVDHIDRNVTNNHASNLRWVTDSENLMNMAKPKTNTSGAKNVSWHKKAQKWQVSFWKNKTFIYIGLFSDYDDAVLNAHEARYTHLGEYARDE